MSRAVTILTALTAREMGDFLPEPLLGGLRGLAGGFVHLDTETVAAADYHRALMQHDPEVLLTCWKTPPLPARLPPALRYVCHLSGSVRNLITRRQIEEGLLVSNWGGSISRIVAEWALFHIIACLRRTTHWTIELHLAGGWKDDHSETASLFGRRVGLHGFGRVARELVSLLRPFGCHLSAFAPDMDAAAEARHDVRRAASLEALFDDNDIIVELAPLIPGTTGIVTERLLRLIRPGGVFVNVGRGAVVDETALLRVAQEGRILIGLDVFAEEPLPANSGFRGLRNVTLTPHLAGPTTERRRDAGDFALANLRAYASGQPLQALITPEVYDAST